MSNSYSFAPQVKSAIVIFAVLLCVLVVTIPGAIYLLVKRSSAKLELSDDGLEVSGLGGRQRWKFDDLERIGLLSIHVTGGGASAGLGHRINGGSPAVNLCGRTKKGKTRKFMISRFENYEEILAEIERTSGLRLEQVGMGAFGPKWPTGGE